MKTALLFASGLLALTGLSLTATAAPVARERLSMDAGWRFKQDAPTVLRNAAALTAWRWRSGADVSGTDGPDWKEAKTGDDIFAGRVGFAVYRAVLPALSGRGKTLHFGGVDDNAVVSLNGKELATHSGWNEPFDVPLDGAWVSGGPNVLTVKVENTAGGGGITGSAALGLAPVPAAGGTDPARPGFNDRVWRTVHLPHDYVVEGKFDPTGDASHGSLIPTSAWYRKTFTLPKSDAGKAIWIDFDGAYRDSTVYLNGKKLGNHPCGYTPFHFDISSAAKYGAANVLAVHVNPQKFEGWWYEGGGIYRHVWLNKASAAVHVAPWGVFVTTKMPEPVPGQPAAPAVVTIETTLDATGRILPPQAAPRAYLVSTILDASGKTVASVTTNVGLSPYTPYSYTQTLTVTKPALWSLERPQLYTLHTEVRGVDNVIDTQDTPFGIRTIRYDANTGFFLNGKSVKIKGTCNHQDFAGVGVAMPDSLLYVARQAAQKDGQQCLSYVPQSARPRAFGRLRHARNAGHG